MIDAVDLRLIDWANEVVGDRIATLVQPSAEPRGRRVGLYLLEVMPAPSPRGAKRPHITISLRYLVTAWADHPEEAHRLFGALLFAALENPEFEVELEPLPLAAWSAFGTAPLPSFILRLPLRKDLAVRPVKMVRRPVVVQVSPTASLHGVVTGPDEVPLAGALVEAPALRLATRTDTRGRFRFAAIPANGTGTLLRVTAKGHEQLVNTREAPGESPLVIHFSMEE